MKLLRPFTHGSILGRQPALMSQGAGIDVMKTILLTVLSGFQLALLLIYQSRPPKGAEGREVFARLAANEWALWATFPLAFAIVLLGVRAIFAGVRAYRTGTGHPFAVVAAMLMLGIVLQAVTGARSLGELRTELLHAVFVFGLPWIDAFEGWLRRLLGSRRP